MQSCDKEGETTLKPEPVTLNDRCHELVCSVVDLARCLRLPEFGTSRGAHVDDTAKRQLDAELRHGVRVPIEEQQQCIGQVVEVADSPGLREERC